MNRDAFDSEIGCLLGLVIGLVAGLVATFALLYLVASLAPPLPPGSKFCGAPIVILVALVIGAIGGGWAGMIIGACGSRFAFRYALLGFVGTTLVKLGLTGIRNPLDFSLVPYAFGAAVIGAVIGCFVNTQRPRSKKMPDAKVGIVQKL